MKLAALVLVVATAAAAAPSQVIQVEVDRDDLAASWSALVVHEPEPGGLLVPANADASWFRVGLQANDIVRYLDGAHVTDLDSLRDGIHVLELDRRGQRVLLRVVIHGPSTVKTSLSESSYQDVLAWLADPDPRTTPVRDKQGPSGVRVIDYMLTFNLELERGDIVRTVGGVPVHTNAAFVAAIQQLPVGFSEIVVERYGRRVTIELERAAPIDRTTIQRVSATRFDIPHATFEAMQEDASLLQSKVSSVPVMERGVMTGLRLFDIKPDSLCAALGLQNDDVLLAIEGRSIGSFDSVFAARTFMINAGQIKIELTRKRKRIAITYVIH